MLPPCVVVNGSPEHKTWITQVFVSALSQHHPCLFCAHGQRQSAVLFSRTPQQHMRAVEGNTSYRVYVSVYSACTSSNSRTRERELHVRRSPTSRRIHTCFGMLLVTRRGWIVLRWSFRAMCVTTSLAQGMTYSSEKPIYYLFMF